MVFKIALALCVLVAVASAVPAAGATDGVNPWIPQWSPCTKVGPSCANCYTKRVCTKVGSIQRTCTNLKTPYCNLGECSATPSTECASIIPVPVDVD